MEFVLLLHGDEAAELALSPDERRAMIDRHIELSREMRETGVMVAGTELGPSARAILVRPGDGGSVVDGPFAESKEQIGGLYIVECADRDEAIAWARRIPPSPGLVVEVRPA